MEGDVQGRLCDHGSQMRADAARNVEAVLLTGARMLADDPTVSVGAIAREAGVDRSTVYRRFPTRESRLAAVFEAKLDAAEEAVDAARLEEAPIAVALHRLVEGIVEVSRRWPVDLARMREDEASERRADELRARFDAFLERAARKGAVRPGLDLAWARDVLLALIDLACHGEHQAHLAPGSAAHRVTDTFRRAIGPAAA